jgi:hypothetical protein
MFKNIISPVQAWLLSQGRCVGCGLSLEEGKKENNEDGLEKITCKCGRIYMYDTKTKRFRRAKLQEV